MAHIIYFDIETVSGKRSYTDLSESMQLLRDKKCFSWITPEKSSSDLYTEKAWIYAEFGKIVCISCGYYTSEHEFITQSFFWDDEVKLLSDFFSFLVQSGDVVLCGHNSKEFDIPYVCRRALIGWLILPGVLQLRDKKPREIAHKDTMELWKFGDYKNYTSLALLCELFWIPTSKDDINGSEVGRVYWEENDLDRIVVYCEKDIIATAQLYQKLR